MDTRFAEMFQVLKEALQSRWVDTAMTKNSDHHAPAWALSRRDVLKGSALSMGAMAAAGVSGPAVAQSTSSALPITVAGY